MNLLKKIAFPISLLYALVVYIRNFLYDVGIFKSKSFKTPIICIGNLSVGGTGKTPMVEFLISHLKKEYKVAILSRGYKRKSNGFVLANANSTVEELGDEPFQVYSKFPEAIVAVDADRRNGISALEKNNEPDVIVLDDAFQHRKVKPSKSILLTAYGDLYTNDWYLPTGNLRDSKREAKRADYIVVTKCPPNLTEAEQMDIKNKLQSEEHQYVLFTYLKYDQEIKGSNLSLTLDFFKDKEVVLVTGIANSKPLVNFLNEKSILVEHLAFKDHHFFTADEIDLFNSKKIILTTEKDYVRLNGKVENLYYFSIKHKFFRDGDKLLVNDLRSLIN